MGGKQLIINADDFGMSHEFNVAICNLLRNQCISSASLMANGLAYQEAVSMIRDYKLHGIGVHLTLTRESFSNINKLVYRSLSHGSSIEDEKGLLLASPDQLSIQGLDDEIISEIRSQIRLCINDNISITHIDNHMYSLMPRMGYRGYRLFFSAYKGIKINKTLGVRIASDYYKFDNMNYIWGGRKLLFYLWWNRIKNHLRGVDYSFAFPYYAPQHETLKKKKELLYSFFNSLRDGITEIHFHPAIDSDAIREYNPYWANRIHEYELLKELSPIFLKKNFGIELVSYEDICH